MVNGVARGPLIKERALGERALQQLAKSIIKEKTLVLTELTHAHLLARSAQQSIQNDMRGDAYEKVGRIAASLEKISRAIAAAERKEIGIIAKLETL